VSGPAGGDARRDILAAVRRAAVPPAELPDLLYLSKVAREGPPDLVRQFVAALHGVGGEAVEVPERGALFGAVAALPAVRGTRGAAGAEGPVAPAEARGDGPREIVCCVPGLDLSSLTLGPDAPRAQLDAIALAVVPGRLGVAENAAVWVDEADLPHRALPFVAQHLAIVLRAGDVVADLHEAYRRLPRPLPGYGVFISGPSKTADIEQALVIGAQGPNSLVVLLV
jgi:L-lactate dehydrogenase complex protein LldG